MNPLLITREVDYSLRILRALSSYEQLSTGALCKQQAIPQQFAYKILRKLAKGGFVSIARGTDGGCRLIVDLTQKSLYDLIGVMNAAERINACLQPGYACSWQQSCKKPCAIHARLGELQQTIDRALQAHSLASLLEEGSEGS